MSFLWFIFFIITRFLIYYNNSVNNASILLKSLFVDKRVKFCQQDEQDTSVSVTDVTNQSNPTFEAKQTRISILKSKSRGHQLSLEPKNSFLSGF